MSTLDAFIEQYPGWERLVTRLVRELEAVGACTRDG
ncbi:Uncharacterised protein [Mycobacteroides abscessus subsp. massiliense]|nr:Uncharacterised protein [Mycobacteroides abscessus subsp. massiliense]SKY65756.1 Uncharacterised protein [Mycobacteroides abscessus subsp. massiliense]